MEIFSPTAQHISAYIINKQFHVVAIYFLNIFRKEKCLSLPQSPLHLRFKKCNKSGLF